MDIAMVLGGAVIALMQGMDPDGVARVTETLRKLAGRETCSPAERHIFQVIADAVAAPQQPKRPQLTIIQGGKIA
jgi:hypothetical protein